MARYTKASIQTLREQADLVDIIGKYVSLKRAGAYFKGCCPFHEEKTPSFTVHKASHHYHCFGCGAHGDAISFLMQYERLDFQQAVHFLAERTGVQLVVDDTSNPVEAQEEKKRSRLRACNEEAMRFYHALLLYSPLANEARTYLQGRGISEEFVRHFSLGYAPPVGEPFTSYLQKKGYTRQEMEEAGLISHGHDFFSERILFPILDARGFVIGFSGRKWKESTPGGKYINTRETLLFKKSRLFFGLSYSKRRMAKDRIAILVEGQLDALRLIHAGFQMTIATLGTAFGEAHVELLRAMGVEQVYVTFDQDSAGQKSSVKAGHLLMKKGIDVKVVSFQGAKDPDELVQTKGVLGLYDAILESTSFVEFLVLMAKKRSDFSLPAEKQKEVEEIRLLISEWENPILVLEAIRQLARLTDIPEALLKEGALSSTTVSPQPTLKSADAKNREDVIEKELMKWLFFSLEHSEEVARLAREAFSKEELVSPLFQKLYQSFLSLLDDKKPLLLMSLLELFDVEEMSSCEEIFQENTIRMDRAKQAVIELMNKIKERNWRRKRDVIREEINRCSSLEQEKALVLAKELSKLGVIPIIKNN